MSIEEDTKPTPNMDRYLEWTNQLKQNFSYRFQDFEHISDALDFLQDQVQFSLSEVEHLAKIFIIDCAKMETDIIVLQSCPTGSTIDWRNVTQYYIRLLAAKILSIFSSAYICEVTFSAMKAVKCNTRSRLTDENLEHKLSCSTTSFTPNFDLLIEEMDCKMAH